MKHDPSTQVIKVWLNHAVLTAVAGAAVGLATPTHGQPLVSYRFDADTQGWTAIDIPSGEICNAPGSGGLLSSSWVASGGRPGGCFFFREPGNTGIDPLIRAPRTIAGNFGAASGGYLRFDRRSPNNNGLTISEDVYMQGVVGGQTVTLITNAKGIPFSQWQTQRIPLSAGEWSVGSCSGPLATQNEINAVLAGLTEIKLKAEYRSGTEDHYIDNVMLLPPDGLAVSNFAVDAEGWIVVGDYASFGFIAAEGSQIVRCFKVTDATRGRGMAFSAPAAFLGNKLDAIGKTIELDLFSTVGLGAVQPDGGSGGFVILRSATKSLYFRNNNLPIVGGVWRHHAVPLVPSPAWTRSGDGAAATQADFAEVLSALTAFEIRAEYETGGESNYIDSVVMGSGSPSVTADPASSIVCPGTPATITATVSGTPPFTYHWLQNGVEIDPATNPTASARTLLIPAASNSATYACIVSNDRGSVTSNPAVVTVCAADFNCDGFVDGFDYDQFVECFEGLACPAGRTADYSGDGFVDGFDYDLFVTDFESGC